MPFSLTGTIPFCREGNGQVILHLNTTYRLTTHLNAYGTFWLDVFMRDIQNYILPIEKERCEAQTAK